MKFRSRILIIAFVVVAFLPSLLGYLQLKRNGSFSNIATHKKQVVINTLKPDHSKEENKYMARSNLHKSQIVNDSGLDKKTIEPDIQKPNQIILDNSPNDMAKTIPNAISDYREDYGVKSIPDGHELLMWDTVASDTGEGNDSGATPAWNSDAMANDISSSTAISEETLSDVKHGDEGDGFFSGSHASISVFIEANISETASSAIEIPTETALDISRSNREHLFRRMAGQRIRIYRENAKWAAASDEYKNIEASLPLTVPEKLDMAQILTQAGRMRQAGNIADSVFEYGTRAQSEQAYDIRHRARRGVRDSFSIKYNQSVSDETPSVTMSGTVTKTISDNAALSVEISNIGLRSTTTLGGDTSSSLGAVGLFVAGSDNREMSIELFKQDKQHNRGTSWSFEGKTGIGKSGEASINLNRSVLWSDSQMAYSSGGVVSDATFALKTITSEKHSISVTTGIRKYYLFSRIYVADETSYSLALSRSVISKPFGAAGMLRNVDTTLEYSDNRIDSIENFSNIVSFQSRTSLFSLGVSSKLQIGRRATFSFAVSAGKLLSQMESRKTAISENIIYHRDISDMTSIKITSSMTRQIFNKLDANIHLVQIEIDRFF